MYVHIKKTIVEGMEFSGVLGSGGMREIERLASFKMSMSPIRANEKLHLKMLS